jgi:hypothetical protein
MEPANNGPGYEKTDATLRAAVLLVALTAVLVAVGVISMWFLYGFIIEYQSNQDEPPSPLAETVEPFTGPRLQVEPPLDMKALEALEQEILGSYGWIDREAGVVHIPIERAMDLLAERGLPKKQTASGQEK